MAPHIALAARARRYARNHCPAYGKGRPMPYAVARYCLRLYARGACPHTSIKLYNALAHTPQVQHGY